MRCLEMGLWLGTNSVSTTRDWDGGGHRPEGGKVPFAQSVPVLRRQSDKDGGCGRERLRSGH